MSEHTLQGWLKGINSDLLEPKNDMGQDGVAGTANASVGRDAFGMSIGYYGGTSANAASCQTACKVTENALDTAGCRGILAADGWRGKYVVCLGQPPQQVELDRGQHLVLADEIDTASK